MDRRTITAGPDWLAHERSAYLVQEGLAPDRDAAETRVLATSALAALDAWADDQGFAPYSEVSRDPDAGIPLTRYRDDETGRGPILSSVFTNHYVYVWAEAETVTKCRTCGDIVTAKDPAAFPYCRNCYYVGNAYEDIRAESLAYFGERLPGASVSVWHTGGGCFCYGIKFADDETGHYMLTDGEASLPSLGEDDAPIRGGWGYVGYYADDDDCEGTEIAYRPSVVGDEDYWNRYPLDALTDDEAIAAVLAHRAERGK